MTTRRELLLTGLASSAIGTLPKSVALAHDAAPSPWKTAAEIALTIQLPVFPAHDFPLPKFGAVGDGKTDCTSAFAEAIETCHQAGGGRVVVPPGRWQTGAIHLKSNVNLHLAKGATISFSTRSADYLPIVLTRWEGVELMNYSPLIYAFEQENIAVTGEGILDGNADKETWWPWCGARAYGWQEGAFSQTAARHKLFIMGDADVPVEQRLFGEGSWLRPSFVEPYRCKKVLIEGISIQRAPFWQLHPVLCRDVTIRNVTIDSDGPNNDGCDPECSQNVLTENCRFNTGDDCIAIKSGRNGDGRRVGIPSQDIIIRNCQMRNGHGGITIGSEISGGVRNVFAENCRMDSPNLGSAIRLKNNAMRGGTLEHIYVRRMVIGRVAHAVLTIDLNYEEGANGPFKPVVRDVRIETTTSGESLYGVDIQGLPEAPVYDVALHDCDFHNVSAGNIVKYAENLSVRGVKINGSRYAPERKPMP